MSEESNIQFEQDAISYGSRSEKKGEGGMTAFLIKSGLVRSKKGASYILLVFAIILIIASLLIFLLPLFKKVQPPTVEELEKIYQLTPPSL